MNTSGFSNRILKAGCVFLGAVLLFCSLFSVSYAESDSNALRGYINSVFSAKLNYFYFFNEEDAGTTTCDWIAFSMARYSAVYSDGERSFYFDAPLSEYAEAAEKNLRDFYENTGITASAKLTEYFRTSIVLTALGKDVSDIVKAATLYNSASLSRLAVLTLAYSLIALNMTDISEDGNCVHTKADYVDRLLSLRHDDGGWSLSAMMGGGSDVDVTSMVLQALAPYYKEGRADVVSAVDEALDFLSKRQRGSGDFVSYGIFNTESTAQVIVALTELGIDVLSDPRFIKDGATPLDGLLLYRLSDGSFMHSFTFDSDNSSVIPGTYNYLATDQASYALVALWRQQAGLNSLYNMRPDTPFSKKEARDIISSVLEFLQRIINILRTKLYTSL